MPDTPNPTRRTRLSPEARQQQLLSVATEMLLTIPFEQITVDAVATKADVSRALVFHYFPTIRDLHSAAANSAAGEMITSISSAIADVPQGERFPSGLAAFVDFVEVRPQTFQAISKLALADEEFGSLFEDVRWQMVQLLLEHTEAEVDTFMTQLMRGWVALAESVVQQWALDKSVSKTVLVDSLIDIGRSLSPSLDVPSASS